MNFFKKKDKSADIDNAKEYMDKIVENYEKLSLDRAASLAAEIIDNGKIDDKKVEQFKAKLKEVNQQLEEMSDDCTFAAGKSISKSNSRTADVANSVKNLLDSWSKFNDSILKTKFTPGTDLSDRFNAKFQDTIDCLNESEENTDRLIKNDTFYSIKDRFGDLIADVRADLQDFNKTLVALGKGVGALSYVTAKTVKLPDGTKVTKKETDFDVLAQATEDMSVASVKNLYKRLTEEEDDVKRAKLFYQYQDSSGKLIIQELDGAKRKTKNPIKLIKLNKAKNKTQSWINVAKNLASLNKKKSGDPEAIPEALSEKEEKLRKTMMHFLNPVKSSTPDLQTSCTLIQKTVSNAVACVEKGKPLAVIIDEKENPSASSQIDRQNPSNETPQSTEVAGSSGSVADHPDVHAETEDRTESEPSIESLRLKMAKSSARDVYKNFENLKKKALDGDSEAVVAIQDIADNKSGDATYEAQRVARKFLREKRDAIKKSQASDQVSRSGHVEAGKIVGGIDGDGYRDAHIDTERGLKNKKMLVGKHFAPETIYNKIANDGEVRGKRNVLEAVKNILFQKADFKNDLRTLQALSDSNVVAAKVAIKILIDSGVTSVIESAKNAVAGAIDDVADITPEVKSLAEKAVDDKKSLGELVFAASNNGVLRLAVLNALSNHNDKLFGHAHTVANAISAAAPNDADFKKAIASLPDEASEWGVSKTEQIAAFKKVAEESALNADKAALINTLHGVIGGWANETAIDHLHTVCAAIRGGGGAANAASKSAAIKCCRITGVPGIKEADCKTNTLDLFKNSLTQANMKASLGTLAGIAAASLSGTNAFDEFNEVCTAITGGAGSGHDDGAVSDHDPVWSALIAAAGTDGGDFHPNAAACKKLEANATLNVANFGDLIANLRAINAGHHNATVLKNIVDANAGFVGGWQINAGGKAVADFKALIDAAGGGVGVAGVDNEIKAEWFPALGIGYNMAGGAAGVTDPAIKKELDALIIKINCKIPSDDVADKHKAILTRINSALTNAGGGAPDWRAVAATHNFNANFAAAVAAVDPMQAENKAAVAVINALNNPGGNPVAVDSEAYPLALKTYAISSADIDRQGVGNAALTDLENLAKAGDENAMNALTRLGGIAGGDADATGNSVRPLLANIRTYYDIAKKSAGAAVHDYKKNKGDIVTEEIKTWLAEALSGNALSLANLKAAANKVPLPEDQIYGNGAALATDYRKRQDANRALEIYNSKQIKNDPLKTAIVNALKTVDRNNPNDKPVYDPEIIQWLFDGMQAGVGPNGDYAMSRHALINTASAGGQRAESIILALDKTLKLATPATLPQANRDTLTPVAVEAHKRYDAARKK